MATTFLIVLVAACACAFASFPPEPKWPSSRNTIFGDERLQNGIFEHLNEDSDALARNNEEPRNIYRLPTSTRPSHYDVFWEINISNLTFSGNVDIQLYATQAGLSEIVLHCHDLNISSLVLRHGGSVIPTNYSAEPVLHFLRIQLVNQTLQYNPNNPVFYQLSISFDAPLRTDMSGIYQTWFRNNYTDEVSWMASTQFQPTSARSAFPCYDEPSFKATFDITIRRPSTHNSWSCTRIRETINNVTQGYDDDVYHRTPIMSTYLIAIIVAEYEALALYEGGQLMYEVIARPGAMSDGQGDYAFNVGIQLLAEMSNHTAIDFYSVSPDIKMTQAAIPDFSAGAMENWGLLTYREAYLMYDRNHTNGYFHQIIAYILSHEIAHMWFGNLVTCDWWDVLWLNEGFARYYQYFLTHWVEDYMGFDTRFIVEQVHAALLTDSSNNPHPLSTSNIGSPASVSGMFSTLSYNKGAAVIRMTEHLLGFDVHRQGLRNYMVNKAFDTALPIDLFEALQNASVVTGAIAEYGPEFSVIDYYRSWTEQSGHPVLNVQVNHQTGEMTIYQRRFNINTGYSSAINTNYIVPISFATASNPDFENTKPSHIIRKAVTVINRGSVGDEWVVFNKQQTGYYRVNYDDYTWDLIILALRSNNRTLIHEYNRAQIVNDVFQFARSGLMSYERAFNILSFLENETEYAPWAAAIVGFNWIRNRLAGTEYIDRFENLIAGWGQTAINQLTYYPINNESFMRSYLRYQLATFLCNLNVAACRSAALTQLALLTSGQEEVAVDSRNWVYCNGLREGSVEDFNFLWRRFLEHNVYTEKIQLLMVLGCTPHAESLNIFLDAIVQENFIVRPQDYTSAFNSAVTGNENNTQIVFSYVQNNLDTVIQAFGSASTPLSYISSRLRTIEDVNAFQSWANANRDNLGQWYQTVYNGAEASRQSIQWASDTRQDFESYFTNGDQNLQYSTPIVAPIVQPQTVTPPSLVEPVTPDLPATDSAVTTCISMVVATFTLVANFVL